MGKNQLVSILIPFELEEFWAQKRIIIREEVTRCQKDKFIEASLMETAGLTERPLYKIKEICSLFRVTKPTIYDWTKHSKLKRIKIRSRVYFWGEISDN